MTMMCQCCYVCLNLQNDVGRGAPQKPVIDAQPYRSPNSQPILDGQKQSQAPDLPPRPAHAAPSAASDISAHT